MPADYYSCLTKVNNYIVHINLCAIEYSLGDHIDLCAIEYSLGDHIDLCVIEYSLGDHIDLCAIEYILEDAPTASKHGDEACLHCIWHLTSKLSIASSNL